MMPAHEHDCEFCTFVGSYRLRHPYVDATGQRTGVRGARVTDGDVYLACGGSSYGYIVRYGRWGEYATTPNPARYVLGGFVSGRDV
jgi:hypothetical protein